MGRRLAGFLILGLCLLGLRAGSAEIELSPSVELFHEEIGALARGAAESGASAVAGEDGWLFFAPELRHLSVGRFWGDAATEVSRAGQGADALPAIVDFNRQLEERGIHLILLPVPVKAAVWPDKISDAFSVEEGKAVPRVDPYHEEFYRVLREKGVDVLDLSPVFRKQRHTEHGPVHCRQDTHWSGAGIVKAAGMLADRIRAMDWFASPEEPRYEREWDEVEITGDLVRMLTEEAEAPPPEKLQLRFVGGAEAPEVDEESPVLLMGDSHCLVFHSGGDLHATGAGLPDQLTAELGIPVDLMGTRGSGSTTVRVDLYRRCARDSDYLAGKKVVIWCFTARAFTESTQGWRVLPVSP